MSDDGCSLDDYVNDWREITAQTREDRAIIVKVRKVRPLARRSAFAKTGLKPAHYGCNVEQVLHVNHTGRCRYDLEKNLEIPYTVLEQ